MLPDTSEYRRAIADLFHVAQLLQHLPYKVNLTARQIQSTTAHLQAAFRDLEAIYQTINQ